MAWAQLITPIRCYLLFFWTVGADRLDRAVKTVYIVSCCIVHTVPSTHPLPPCRGQGPNSLLKFPCGGQLWFLAYMNEYLLIYLINFMSFVPLKKVFLSTACFADSDYILQVQSAHQQSQFMLCFRCWSTAMEVNMLVTIIISMCCVWMVLCWSTPMRVLGDQLTSTTYWYLDNSFKH